MSLTLKIMYPDSTQWVGGVQSVEDVGVGCTGADVPEDPRQAADAVIDLFPGPASRWKGTINVRPIRPNTWLRSLVVTFSDDKQATYIVPQSDTYLLGSDGQTIDRI